MKIVNPLVSHSKIKSASFMFAIAISFNPKLLKQVDSCKEVQGGKAPSVYIVKQWHMAAGVNTHTGARAPHPQAANQKQIYDQLGEWIDQKKVNTLIAEGCEGSVDDQMEEAFQGWSFNDLKTEYKTDPKTFSDVLAHPVVMAKASHPNVNAKCGDSLPEIKKSQLALSDSRADIGYFTRLNENKNNPEKLKPYLADVREAYHLKPEATLADAEKALASDLKASVMIFEAGIHARDLSFTKAINEANAKDATLPAVLVVGGLHAADLKSILESKQINCTVFEPLAYQNDEEALNSRLKTLTQTK